MPYDTQDMSLRVYLAIEQAFKKWSMPIQNWKPALNQFMMLYEDRLPVIYLRLLMFSYVVIF